MQPHAIAGAAAAPPATLPPMEHGRLPWYAPDELTPQQRAVYDAIVSGPRGDGAGATQLCDDAGRLEGPFNAMLASPGIGGPLQELGAAVRYRTSLPDRLREIATLEVAAAHRSDFEWYAHERLARRAGMTEEEVAAIREGSDTDTFTAAERTVRDLVRGLVRDRDLDDDRYTHARTVLGTATLYEIVVLVGYYELLALGLRAFRTPLPAGVPAPFADAPDRPHI